MAELEKAPKKPMLDPELKKKMRALEEKERGLALQAAPVSSSADEDGKISFDQWWVIMSQGRKIRFSMKEILWADFKSRGLSDKEEQARYDNALKIFGL